MRQYAITVVFWDGDITHSVFYVHDWNEANRHAESVCASGEVQSVTVESDV